MPSYRAIPARRWLNPSTGETASLYGAVPWHGPIDRQDWVIETHGWTVERTERGRKTVGVACCPPNAPLTVAAFAVMALAHRSGPAR